MRITRQWTLSFRLKGMQYHEVYMDYTPCVGPQLSYSTHVYDTDTQRDILCHYAKEDVYSLPRGAYAWRLA